jgi:dsRNA-specific ribonuclease
MTTPYKAQRGVYGKRGSEFKTLITDLLKKGEVSENNIDLLLDQEGLSMFSQAFTHYTVDPVNNYELLETLGDQTANKCVLWYFSKRFPQIFCPQGSDIITRLKIKYIDEESFGEISNKLGFWDYISMTNDVREYNNVPEDKKDAWKPHKILEDVFESFCAVVEILLDKKFGCGGYKACFYLISKIMDDMNISIDYLSLNNPVSILKETYDLLKMKLPTYTLTDKKNNTYIVYDSTFGQIGTGSGRTDKLGKQAAAENAIDHLKKRGVSKKIPDAYLTFCT